MKKRVQLQRFLQKLKNFWYYEKFKVIVGCVIAILAFYGIQGYLQQREAAFSGIILNCTPLSVETLANEFAQHEKIDTNSYEVSFQSNITLTNDYSSSNMDSIQAIFAQISSGSIDFLAAPPDLYQTFSYNTSVVFADLRDYLDEETLNFLEGKLFFIERSFISVVQNAVWEKESYEALEYPDPKRPDLMDDPVPVGVDISVSAKFRDAFQCDGTPIFLGIVDNAVHPETTSNFIKYLFCADS